MRCHSEPTGQRASRLLESHVTAHRLGDPSVRYAALRMTYPNCHSEPAAKRMRSDFVQQRAGDTRTCSAPHTVPVSLREVRCRRESPEPSASSQAARKLRALRFLGATVIADRLGDPHLHLHAGASVGRPSGLPQDDIWSECGGGGRNSQGPLPSTSFNCAARCAVPLRSGHCPSIAWNPARCRSVQDDWSLA